MKTTKLEISKVDGGIRLHVGEFYVGSLIAPAEDIARIVQALQLGSGVASGVDLVIVGTERTEPNKKTAGLGVQQVEPLQAMVGDVVDQMARIVALEPEQENGQAPFDVGANLQLLRHIITRRSEQRRYGGGLTVENRPVCNAQGDPVATVYQSSSGANQGCIAGNANENLEPEPPF